MQGKQNVWPVLLCEYSAGQSTHVSDSPTAPTVSENLPASQEMQEASDADPLLVEPCLPEPQLVQSDSFVMPVASLQRSSGQPIHDTSPRPSEKRPAISTIVRHSLFNRCSRNTFT